MCKKEFEKETDFTIKGAKLDAYICKQKELTAKIEKEEEEEVKIRFEKMIEEANKGGFWRERRRMNRDETSTWMISKDENGKRILDPEGNKENIARVMRSCTKQVQRATTLPHSSPRHSSQTKQQGRNVQSIRRK